MERRPEITYLLLLCLSTAGALTVTMASSPVTALRGQDVTITCHVSELDLNNAIQLIWSRKLGNVSKDVYDYRDGKVNVSTPRYHVNGEEIWKGNAALRISGVQFADEGEYTCYIVNTPNNKEGRSTLQVSAPPSVSLTPDLHIEPGYEKSAMCEVTGFYPQAITILWVRHHKHSPEYETLQMGKCTTDPERNTDGTFNITSQLILKPQKEDNGNQYSCIVTHRSLEEEIVRSFTLTVTKRDNTWKVIGSVTLLCTLVMVMAVTLYLMLKPYPPTVSDITGNDQLTNMSPVTLTCHIRNFRPNDITIFVCLRRSGEPETIIILTWSSQHHTDTERPVMQNVGEERELLNGDRSHEHHPLQLKMDPVINKNKFGLFSCHCLLHITPNYDTDNWAELSVHVRHPAMTSPVSVRRILNVAGVAPKLMKIMTPECIQHGELVTLTCPIMGFKPRALSITWLRERDGQETRLLTWNPERRDPHMERYSHNVKEEQHEDKSYSFLSALTLRATIMEDDGVTYICRIYHPTTGHRAEERLNMEVTVAPKLMEITTPRRIQHGEEVTLTCPITRFKPKALFITWLRRERDGTESKLVTWNNMRCDIHKERYSHNLKEEEHEDNSYSFFSTLTLRATIMEDDGVTYICKTHHPTTRHRAEEKLNMEVTGGPDRPDAAAAPPSSRDPTNQRGEARAQNRED